MSPAYLPVHFMVNWQGISMMSWKQRTTRWWSESWKIRTSCSPTLEGNCLTIKESKKTFSVTINDGVEQITIPSFAVLLTNTQTSEAGFLVADTRQLDPTIISGQKNEVFANAKLSPLALMTDKGSLTLFLDTTYRLPSATRANRI